MCKSELVIDGKCYVLKHEAAMCNGLPYVIVRGDRSGAFAGFLKSQKDREVVLENARRLWYWEGAASLSQMAITGPTKPSKCKFPEEVNGLKILDAIEVLPATAAAHAAIKAVPVWAV